MNENQIADILNILEREADMTIATVSAEGLPHATTVSYVSDGFTIYFGTSSASLKSQHLKSNNKVSLTINMPYRFWKDITALSIDGVAQVITQDDEFRKVGKLLYEKFPQVHEFAKTETENVSLYKIDPHFISHLDYRKGFGHVEKHSVESIS